MHCLIVIQGHGQGQGDSFPYCLSAMTEKSGWYLGMTRAIGGSSNVAQGYRGLRCLPEDRGNSPSSVTLYGVSGGRGNGILFPQARGMLSGGRRPLFLKAVGIPSCSKSGDFSSNEFVPVNAEFCKTSQKRCRA